jgi:hypothetical protein
MNRVCIALSSLLLASTMTYGQGSTSTPAASATVGHGAFPVKVTKTLDSSKLKEGDTVQVETAGGFKLPDGTLVPKGSKLTGHVTAAKARSKGDPDSRLTVAFDRLSIANGKELAIKGTVQAVFPPADEVDPGVPGSSTTHGGGGAGLTAGSVPPPDYRPMTEVKTGANTASNPGAPSVDPKSAGVQGIDNLQLDNGVLTSKGKNVKLGSGDRMIVHVDIFQ